MADAHKNFSISAVTNNPGTGGTSLTITSGHTTRFPDAPFNATVCPASTTPDPSNSEIVRVIAVDAGTNTFTIQRAQENTTARNIVATDSIFASVTVKTLTDVETVANLMLLI